MRAYLECLSLATGFEYMLALKWVGCNFKRLVICVIGTPHSLPEEIFGWRFC